MIFNNTNERTSRRDFRLGLFVWSFPCHFNDAIFALTFRLCLTIAIVVDSQVRLDSSDFLVRSRDDVVSIGVGLAGAHDVVGVKNSESNRVVRFHQLDLDSASWLAIADQLSSDSSRLGSTEDVDGGSRANEQDQDQETHSECVNDRVIE